MRLQNRLFLSYMAVAAAASMIVATIVYQSANHRLRDALDTYLDTTLGVFAIAVETGTVPTGPDALDAHIDAIAAPADARLTLVDREGRVIADSEFDGAELADLDDHSSRAEIIAARASGEGRSIRYSRSVGTEMVYVARRIERGPWTGSVVRIAVPEDRLRHVGRGAAGGFLVGLPIALAVAVLAGLFWSRRLARPVGQLKAAAEAVRSGNFDTRVRIQTGDELEELAVALEHARDDFAARIADATRERDQLSAVLEGMVEGVVVTDRNGRVVVANPALATLFGVSSPSMGYTVVEALRHPEVGTAMDRARRSGERVVSEIVVSYPEARTLRLHATGLALGGAVGVFHDVTALKRVNAMRQDFVANVSHELRTPLAALSAHAESLLESDLSPGEKEASIAAIRRQVDRLTELVSDLLQLSELESERFSLSTETVDVGEYLRSVAAEWADRAARRGQRISVDVEPGLTVTVDSGLLRQALTNLVQNAVKYAGEGAAIQLTGRTVPGFTEIAVVDDGPGISPDEQSRVFERFYRVEKSRARANGGTGLGLAIVKHIAEVHGGHITLETRPGQGSAFRIALPI